MEQEKKKRPLNEIPFSHLYPPKNGIKFRKCVNRFLFPLFPPPSSIRVEKSLIQFASANGLVVAARGP